MDGGEVFCQEGCEVAEGQVARVHEAEFYGVEAVARGLDQSLDAEVGDAAGGEGAGWAVEGEIDADGAFGLDRGPGNALAGNHEIDDLLVVPEELNERAKWRGERGR